MERNRIGIQLASLRQSFKKALHTCAELGAGSVEIDARNQVDPRDFPRTAIRQLRKMLDDLNLRVAAVSFQTRRGYEVAADLQPRIEATKRAMQFAFDLGANVVINHVGRIPTEAEGDDWDRLRESLYELGRHGQHCGATLLAETGSEDPATLKQLLDSLPTGTLGVNLDPGNLIINGFSVADSIRALGSQIMHVHAKDGVRDLAQGRGIEVPLGRGIAEFPEILALLEEFAYRGQFTIERENAHDPVGEISDAVQYLASM